MALIYQCPHRDRAPASPCLTFNQGKREKCRGCGARVLAIAGTPILARWRGDGAYALSDAVKTYATMGAAERAASRAYDADNRSSLVARFIFQKIVTS
jgi:hypothetical protein